MSELDHQVSEKERFPNTFAKESGGEGGFERALVLKKIEKRYCAKVGGPTTKVLPRTQSTLLGKRLSISCESRRVNNTLH